MPLWTSALLKADKIKMLDYVKKNFWLHGVVMTPTTFDEKLGKEGLRFF